MINVVNISKRVLDEILSKDITRITNLTEEKTSIADQILNLLNDIFTTDSYETDDGTTLELVDNINMYNTDIDFTPESNSSDFSAEFTAFTLGYVRQVVDFARSGIAFTTVQPRSNTHARKRPFTVKNGDIRAPYTDFVYTLKK